MIDVLLWAFLSALTVCALVAIAGFIEEQLR